MYATSKQIRDMTAADLMRTPVVTLLKEMPMREAARLLLHNQVSGAPVVDALGRCIGVLSAIDFLALVGRYGLPMPVAPGLSVSCTFQAEAEGSGGGHITTCTLPEGACPYQMRQTTVDGRAVLACRQPRCVCADWQLVEAEMPPAIEVGAYMTADPVTVPPDMPLRVLAREMIDAHIHRLVVVDERRRPVGIVSSTDLLAALAYAGDGPREWPEPPSP
jgi:CBS domain-containing protein